MRKGRRLFTMRAGVLPRSLRWRSELDLYRDGLRDALNVWPLPGGGVRKRPGTFVLPFATATRARPFHAITWTDEEGGDFIILFYDDGVCEVWDANGRLVQTLYGSFGQPVSTAKLGDTIIIGSPFNVPQVLQRQPDYSWTIRDWQVPEIPTANGKRLAVPHVWRESRDGITLTPSGTSGNITLTASADLFDDAWVGRRLRIRGREVEVTAVTSPTQASATVHETLQDANATLDWQRQAWGPQEGYPWVFAFHSGRLWCTSGGLEPYMLYGSAAADWFNFDLGEGLDDEAIALPAAMESTPHSLLSAQDLFVFSEGEVRLVPRNGDGTYTPKTATVTTLDTVGSISNPVVYQGMVVWGTAEGLRGALPEGDRWAVADLAAVHAGQMPFVTSLRVLRCLGLGTVLHVGHLGGQGLVRIDPGEKIVFYAPTAFPADVLIATSDTRSFLWQGDTDGGLLTVMSADAVYDIEEPARDVGWQPSLPFVASGDYGASVDFTEFARAPYETFPPLEERAERVGFVIPARIVLLHPTDALVPARVSAVYMRLLDADLLRVDDRAIYLAEQRTTGNPLQRADLFEGVARSEALQIGDEVAITIEADVPAPVSILGVVVEYAER